METTESKELIVDQAESIKLIKNSRGYGWEIKILSTDIARLEQLNSTMQSKFGITSNEISE